MDVALCIGALGSREALERCSRQVDFAAERVASRTEALPVGRGRRGVLPLHELCLFLYGQNQRQQAWVDTMIKESSAQAVVVPS